MYEDPKSRISQLEKILDSREDQAISKTRRHELHEKNLNVSQEWNDSEFRVGDEVSEPIKRKEEKSLSIKILIGSVIFFIVALVVVALKFLVGGNIVSGNNIEITVNAPVSISGGEILSFEVEVKNNNNTSLLGADLGINFPVGTKQASDISQTADRLQQFLGDIAPGKSVKKNISVVLFGSENQQKDIDISLEYKVSGSNSLFNKTKKFSVLISSSPVSIVVRGPEEINTNQSLDFNVEITSNSTTVLKGLLFKVDYPFGFSFTSSNPKTTSKNNVWLIGDLESGAKRTISFSGVLAGQEGEERGFTFTVGSPSKSDNLVIDIPLSSSFSSITIRRPFVSADVLFNELDTKEYVSAAGSEVQTLINWQNNLPYDVSNVSIIVKLSGNDLDKSSVQVDNGFYQSLSNTIIFNQTTDKSLVSLEPGKSGTSKFSFSSFSADSITGSGLINPTIVLDITVSGQRVGYGDDQSNVLFSDSRKVKITANPQLLAKSLYYVGPFQNNGPIPPKAEQETTYTITWTITNPLNNLSGAKVVAVLPPYVKWMDLISPGQENVNYDSTTGQVTWNVGNISSGAGRTTSAKEVSFQVSLLPSVSQIGEVPDLIGEAVLTAKDNYTLTSVTDSFSGLTTRLNNDPYFKINGETVIQ